MRRLERYLIILLVVSLLFASSVNVFSAPKKGTTPPAPTLGYSPMTSTNGNVTVTIYYPSTAVVKQYRLGTTSIWSTYSSPIVLTSNAYIVARYQNKSGKWSDLGGVTVSNIINEIPLSNPTFSSSPTVLTNQNVSVTINFSPDSVEKQFKIGNNELWTSYTAPIILDTNETIYAKASDAVGNWTSISSYTVNNIDKESPNNPSFLISTTELTNKDVVLSILYSIDSDLKQYKIEGTDAWIEYTSPLNVSSNRTIIARSSDAAGNWSSDVNYVVDNIDKTPPISPIIESTSTDITNTSAIVTITYSEDSSIKLYKIGLSNEWENYTGPIILNTNDSVYAKAADAIGNWTPEINYVVEDIDTMGPTTPIIMVSTNTSTYEPVMVTILFDEESILKQYKVGLNGIWINYTVPIVLTGNNIVYAKSSDSIGNWSLEANFSVDNIIKMVLGYTVKYGSTDKSSYNSIVANTNTLNEIATATYTVDALGNLTGIAPTDQITYANNNNMGTKLMVSNSFDSNIAKLILQSPENRQNLKNNIVYLLQTYDYKGVDIDIENIPASSRDQFTIFMSEVYGALKPLGYSVSVAVQAKTYDSPNATWNYGFDYKSLAMYSDYLMIMAYDEHYPGGTPGAVASIDWVKSVINYTLTVVPKEKIVLGLAAYGYDWSAGATKAYSINGCYNLASQYGATIYFDNITKSKYFTYTTNGVVHTVWFEDSETIPYKLDLVNSKDLKGIGIWRLGLENASFWDAIRSKIRN